MSDQTTVEVVDTQQSQAAHIEVTPEAIEQARSSNDPAQMQRIIDQLENPGQSISSESPATDMQVQDTPPVENNDPQQSEPVSQPEVKHFVTKYRGNEVKVEDPDGMLGYGNLGRLKKKAIHADNELKYSQEQLDAARNHAAKMTAEAESLKQRIAELQSKYTNTSAPQENFSSGNTPPVSKPQESIQTPMMPVAPIPPKADEYGDFSQEEMLKYTQENYKYQQELGTYLQNLPKTIQTQYGSVQNPEVLKVYNELAELKKEMGKNKQAKESEEQVNRTKKYYEGIKSFWSQHSKELGDVPEVDDLGKYHNDFILWQDKMTEAHGYTKPFTPYNINDPEWRKFEDARGRIYQDYVDDNPDTKNTVQGIPEPAGLQGYVNVLNIINYKNKKVREGVLAENAPLHSAWLMYADEHGTFDKAFEQIETDARSEGVKSTIDMLQNNQANHAINIPNSAQSSTSTKLSVQEMNALLDTSPAELAKDPAKYEQYKLLVESLGRA